MKSLSMIRAGTPRYSEKGKPVEKRGPRGVSTTATFTFAAEQTVSNP